MLPLGPDASAITTVPTGLMRSSTRCSSSLEAVCELLVKSCDRSAITVIGTRNASSTTMTSCFGVLIGEECGSCSGMGSIDEDSRRAGRDGQTEHYSGARHAKDGRGALERAGRYNERPTRP